MIGVISQPAFLPWLGWFDLADQAGIMVVLDDVQFEKRSWQQRNRIRTGNGLDYLTVPVKTSGRYLQKIAECELSDQTFVQKVLGALRANYAKAPFFSGLIEDFSARLRAAAETGRLVELNCALIAWIAERLQVATPMVRASTLGAGGARGEHLAAICERVGANRYLSTAGAEDYLAEDREAFDRRGIQVLIHVYEHPQYAQRFEPFMPYASALDAVFNAGPAAGELMRSGRRPSRELQ